MKTFFTPARCAAMSFSGRPPIGLTPPRRLTSPVMATAGETALSVTRELSAVVSVMPALGPSFGVAPSGTWMCRSFFSKTSACSGK